MANLIRTPAEYAVNFGYSNAKQVLQTLGEEVILLRMYHVNTDADTQPRCGVCYNDVYKSKTSATCAYCYGTSFQGGVKEVWRVWALITDQTQDEKFSKTGVWQNATHQVQTEPQPPLEQNDYMIRINEWNNNKQAPLEIGSYYRIGPVDPVTVRTGARFGGTNTDRIAQKFQASVLPETNVIYQYDVRTQVTFPRFDNQPR